MRPGYFASVDYVAPIAAEFGFTRTTKAMYHKAFLSVLLFCWRSCVEQAASKILQQIDSAGEHTADGTWDIEVLV